MQSLKVIIIAISLTFCVAVDLNEKCSSTRKLVKCANLTNQDYGLIESEHIRIEDSAVLVDEVFLKKFPNVIVMEFYRVNLTFDLAGSSLRKLSIENCVLSVSISDGLRELEVLIVKNTPNGVDLMENLSNLIQLTVSNSSVLEISLKNNKRLSWLDLSYNNLRKVPDDIPDEVSYLDLSGNNIERVTKEDFEDLGNLEVLLLENNKIKDISKGVFDELVSLRRLFLSNNSLTAVDFSEHLQLKFLDLSFNNISKVDDLHHSTRLVIEKEVIYTKPKTASHISLALVIVFCGLVLTFIFYCGK